MRKILLVVVSAMSFAANANLSTVQCTFEMHKDQGYLGFQAYNLFDTEEMELNWEAYTDYDGWETAYTYEGEELEYIWLYMVGDGGGADFDENGDLEISIDSDGCDVGKIHLYQNNGYKFGYMRITHRCSPEWDEDGNRSYPSTYSKVACTIDTDI